MPSSTSSSETGGGRWPRAFLATLALFALSERVLWRNQDWLRFLERYAPPGAGDPVISTARIGLLPSSGENPGVLLVGSSQIREGLDCAVFEVRLPGRVCGNVAVGGGSPLDVIQVARRSEGRMPRRVVVTGLFPKVLHAEPKAAFMGPDALVCLMSSGAAKRMTAREWLDVAYGLLGNASETLRCRDALWAVYESKTPQPDRMLAREPPKPARYFDQRLGLVNFDTRPGAFTPAQEAALDRLIRRETGRGNRVVVIDFPTRPGYESTIPREAIDHYRGALSRLQARTDIVFVPGGSLPPLLLEDFLDFTHLSETGRRKVSERIADILGERGL